MTKPENIDRGFRYQIAAIARDVTAITATVSVLATAFWFVSRPYLEPFLELPEEVARINAQLGSFAAPRLIEFHSKAQIVSEATTGKPVFKPGDNMRLVYNLRRNADCATDVEIGWLNVQTGSRIITGTERAVQAPVTPDFTAFILTRVIPNNLPDGFWVYWPRITPLNCGVYRPYNGNMSDIFEVRRE